MFKVERGSWDSSMFNLVQKMYYSCKISLKLVTLKTVHFQLDTQIFSPRLITLMFWLVHVTVNACDVSQAGGKAQRAGRV